MVFRAAVIAAAVISVMLVFASETDRLITGRSCLTYPMGSSMVNYEAGFIRRGLFGELVMLMNALFQPIVSLMVLSGVSIAFILWLFIRRMIKLRIGLVFILAVIFSPSLILMQRDENFLRSDSLVIAMNLAASCILLCLISRKDKHRISFAGMLGADAVIFSALLISALIHELSAALLPPVMLLFFIFAKRAGRTLHFVLILDLMFVVYAVMMTRFKYSDPGIIAESWSSVYKDSASLKFNPGLIFVADQSQAVHYLNKSLELIKENGSSLLLCFLIAVALPFTVLLLSGIRVFRSVSSRAAAARCLIIISSLGPLGLCLVGIDFGRWISICAINLTAYTLLIAHASGRKQYRMIPEKCGRIAGAAVQCAVIAAAAVLLNYKLHTFGYFYKVQPVWEQAQQVAVNASHLWGDIKPLLTRETIIQKSGC